MSRRAALALLGALGAAACGDLPGDPTLAVDATGVVAGNVVLDVNGSRSLDAGDTPVAGLPVELRVHPSGALAAATTTGPDGTFRFGAVPVGRYAVVADEAAVADSLELLGFQGGPFTLQAADSLALTVALTYPTVTIEAARALPAGRRVFTSGIALNARESFGDGVVHLAGDSLYLRATGVARASVGVGDSIRLLGRTDREAGQPVLRDATPFVLVSLAAVPVAVRVSAAQAAGADGGRLDAALVRLQGAEIADTATEASGDFLVTVRDASGSVVLVFRNYLPVPRALFDRDSVVVSVARGLLRPHAGPDGVRWRLFLRSLDDLGLTVRPPQGAARRPRRRGAGGRGSRGRGAVWRRLRRGVVPAPRSDRR